MATNFPAGLDNLTNPLASDPLSGPSHAEEHASANDAIEALQAKVGVNNSQVVSTLDYRVGQLELGIGAASSTSTVKHMVKNNGTESLSKGQPVYVTGSDGTNMLIGAASNSAESTSSKTFGLLESNLNPNGQGYVISEGLLAGLNTLSATIGDPVWLGSNGALIYGLANKPQAPQHLVFIGIVTRANANNGEIFVKIQNGFEIEELHNVSAYNAVTGDVLRFNASTGLWEKSDLKDTFVTITSLGNTVADYIPISDRGNVDGVASLDSSGHVPDSEIPASIARDTEVSAAVSAHSSLNTNVHGIADTAALATKSYADNAASAAAAAIVNSAPSALDTLKELATALGNDANFSTTITTALGTKITASSTDTLTNKTIGSTGLGFNSGANSSSIYTEGNDMSVYANNKLYLNANSDIVIQPAIGSFASIKGDIISTLNASQTLTNKTISGSNNTLSNIPNSALTNSSITINGSSVSLGGTVSIDGLPSQSGNSGRYLTTNGSIASWSVIDLSAYAPIDSASLAGTPTAPTPLTTDNSTRIATTAFVKNKIDTTHHAGGLYQTAAPTDPMLGEIWIDADDEVTTFDSNIIRRKTFIAAGGEQTFNTDLPFLDGYEQVFFNGLLLVKGTDYTTSAGNTVTLMTSAAAWDVIEIVTVTGANSVQTYTQAEIDTLIANNKTVSPVSISANTNLAVKKRYYVTSSSALTLTLPANPSLDDEIQILDASGNASTYNITVSRNGKLINGNAGNLIIDNNGGWYTLLYTGSTYGWKVG